MYILSAIFVLVQCMWRPPIPGYVFFRAGVISMGEKFCVAEHSFFVLLCLILFFFQKLIHKEVTSSLHLVGRVTQRRTIASRGLPVHATTEDSSTFLFDEQTLDVELFGITLQWIGDIPACLQLRFLLEIFPQSIHLVSFNVVCLCGHQRKHFPQGLFSGVTFPWKFLQ